MRRPLLLVLLALVCGGAILAACTADNPYADAWRMTCFHAGHEDDWQSACHPPDLAVAPDLTTVSCGRSGEACCLDSERRTFCTEGACFDGRCGLPDLAPPHAPDLMWRPDLAGGACVPPCGRCAHNGECCKVNAGSNCFNGRCGEPPYFMCGN